MHVYSSFMTPEEVKSIAKEYGIPIDLHPREPPSTMMMNTLSVNAIASGVRISKGTVLKNNEVIVQHTAQPLPVRTLIPAKSDFQRVVEHDDERVLATKRKSSFGTHHSASPITTVTLGNVNAKAKGSNQALHSTEHVDEETVNTSHNNNNNENEVNSPYFASSPHSKASFHSEHSLHFEHSLHSKRNTDIHSGHILSSSFGGLGLHTFSRQNIVGSGGGSFSFPFAFDVLYFVSRLLIFSYAEKLVAIEREKDALLYKSRGQEEQIKKLKEAIAAETCSLFEAERSVDQLKGDLERLTRLLASDEYKKILSKPFNQAIVVGWSKGIKVGRTEEDAQSILTTADNYDLGCQPTFMSAFDELFTKSYHYVEKLVESFRLSL
uniref:Uncharacterized protein n=1 Tax=Tanacetum cinerariifolium TaxID=118510 RepID=A0A699H4I9_TANCI|nr:hypothetical protein [Tanacetum cinerariifolium]